MGNLGSLSPGFVDSAGCAANVRFEMTMWNRVRAWVYTRAATFFSTRAQGLTPQESSEQPCPFPPAEDMWKELHTSVSECLDRFMQEVHGPDLLSRIQVVYEVLSYKLGVTDGLACLAGISDDTRRDTRFRWIHSGKSATYDAHREKCPECAREKTLWLELHPN